ncbi:transcriptional regulator with XRE-family HTH domain [Thermocatellispora tengchongensis]|uniref:Transcriptional regulator with XRE-family HTH domain n=1 Tax=Thermocatellispora tengchongensis TaxID=1073253 RepID=A0A840NQH2_9ACTN|nr:XRE family transcriptional regulator [Thermocatellispora tengchongensis]MBB5130834.1 transcriptional regulator with XRE-family HTH domain [Thermocatellispora tengchongensis]
MTIADLAEAIEVDPKTVERWITKGREPYRKHRFATASYLGVDESYLCPDALSRDQVAAASHSEVIAVYPHRWTVPRDVWGRLFGGASQEIGVLVYSGLFLADDAGLVRLFADKAREGVRVRILLGDPDCAEVAQRGADGGVGDGMAPQIRSALVLYRPITGLENVEIRLHDTILYNSIYRADDEFLVNTHVYGAGNAAVLHLRRVAGGDMVATYAESFERVWERAVPVGS